ncbi:hypothetical protein H0E87_019913 [Populus deltoides]|uniref:Amino acid transporter transmembrane domain-containing protein n=1 Tax=Populus deltoides TaxID=3696 RepID=A0A8T2XX98_POPDE|nr:hypothetical protein H0E87_019913 [Populus deltoides]
MHCHSHDPRGNVSFFGDIEAVIGAFGCIPLDIILSMATIAPPVKGKMFKGMCVCCAVIVSTYFSVGIISGYWASGNQAQPTILTTFMGDGRPLLPTVNQLLHSYAIGCYHSSTSFSRPPLAELHSVYTI